MKKWYASKTLWVNFAIGFLGLGVMLVQASPLDPETVGMIVTGVAAVNGFLRTLTNAGVEG